MKGEVIRSDIAIEIRERYGDVATDRWPVCTEPLPDELLSSWISRLALANGMPPRLFSGVLGYGDGMWSPRLDLRLPDHTAVVIRERTGLPREALSRMTCRDWPFAPLLLPLRENARLRGSTWLQYCPKCLAEDETPYFRRQWRLASRVSCFVHGCGLRDRCPACRRSIRGHDQSELVPQHFCASCGFDLRTAPKVAVRSDARRLERALADIIRVESARRLGTSGDLAPRIRRALSAANPGAEASITGLSSGARIRCFEVLASGSLAWLTNDENRIVAHRRAMILAAGGHDRLIANVAGVLERRLSAPKPACSTRPSAGLADLLAAYWSVVGGVSSSKSRGKAPVQTAL